MKGSWAALGALLSLVGQSAANLDMITLNTQGSTYIQEAVATLILGEVPSPITGDIALWSAVMMMKDGQEQDFLQGVTQNSPGSTWCQNLGKAWCNFAYMLRGSTATPGTPVKASPGDKVKTHYKLNSSTKKWDQNVYINDKLVSTVSTSQGQTGGIFYVSVECAAKPCDTAPAHAWEDIQIVLNQADESFKHSGSWEHGATGGAMSTPDKGKTWNFSKLNVPAMQAA